MDPNQWGNGSRMDRSNPSEDEVISNFLVAAVQRDAARRNSRETVRRQSLGLAAHRPPSVTLPTRMNPQQVIEDRIVYEALMAAGRAVQPDLQSILNRGQQQDASNESKHIDKPLRIPSPAAELPSMENMQLEGIEEPHPHDVLCGRGGFVNKNPGNNRFRQLVQSQKVSYLQSTKAGKVKISEDIVRAVRNQSPPGRFLSNNGAWYDIGDVRARDKTAQALREGAPDIRQSLQKSPPLQAPVTQPLASNGPQAGGTFLANTLVVPSIQHQIGRGGIQNTAAGAAFRNPLVAGINNAARKPKITREDEAALDALGRAVSLSSNGHSQTAPPPAVQANPLLQAKTAQQMATLRALANAQNPSPVELAAKNIAVQRAQVAQMIAAAQAVAKAGSMPPANALGGLTTKQPRLVAAVNGRAAAMPNIPLDQHSWDAGVPNGALLPGFGRGLSPLVLAQLKMQQRTGLIDPEKLALANAMAQQQQSRQLEEAKLRKGMNIASSVPSLPADLVHRLIIAETIAQRTVNGKVTETMKAEEKRMGLYLDAGLLGIDLGEMAAKRSIGCTEESIVEDAYHKMKQEDVGDKKPSAEPAKKKPKLNEETASVNNGRVRDKDINDALVAIGAMIKLKTHVVERESGSDESNESHESVN